MILGQLRMGTRQAKNAPLRFRHFSWTQDWRLSNFGWKYFRVEIIFCFSFNIGWIQAAFNFKIGSNREHGLATFQVLKIKLSFNLIEKRFRGELKLLHWQNIKPLDMFDETLFWKVINLKCCSPFSKWRSLTCLMLFPTDFSSDEKTLILDRKRTPLIKKVSHYFKPKSF